MMEWLGWGLGDWRWERTVSPGDKDGHAFWDPPTQGEDGEQACGICPPAVFSHEYRRGNRSSLEKPCLEGALLVNRYLESNKYREADKKNKESWQKRGTHLWLLVIMLRAFLWPLHSVLMTPLQIKYWQELLPPFYTCVTWGFEEAECHTHTHNVSNASQVVLVVKNPPANAEDVRDASSTPGLGRSPGGGHGNPFQYPWLENPLDRGAYSLLAGYSPQRCTEPDTTEVT